jgi:hypothetical protein
LSAANLIEGVRGDLILIPANMIDLGAIALPAFGYVSWPADPFDIGATRVADPKLDAELIGTAQRAAVLDTSFDMPVTVLKKPGANVSIIEVETRQRVRAANIASAARFGGEFTNPIRIGRAHMRGAYDGKKHRYQNTLHSLNVARH